MLKFKSWSNSCLLIFYIVLVLRLSAAFTLALSQGVGAPVVLNGRWAQKCVLHGFINALPLFWKQNLLDSTRWIYWEHCSFFNVKSVFYLRGKKKSLLPLYSVPYVLKNHKGDHFCPQKSLKPCISLSVYNTLKDFFSSLQFCLYFAKKKSQCCEREMHLNSDLVLDAASIAFLPDVHFVLSFGSFPGGCDLRNFCNDFITKSGQHRLLTLVSAFSWPMQAVCYVRLNHSWPLYWGCGFIS